MLEKGIRKICEIIDLGDDRVTFKLSLKKEDLNANRLELAIQAGLEENYVAFLRGWVACMKHYSIVDSGENEHYNNAG